MGKCLFKLISNANIGQYKVLGRIYQRLLQHCISFYEFIYWHNKFTLTDTQYMRLGCVLISELHSWKTWHSYTKTDQIYTMWIIISIKLVRKISEKKVSIKQHIWKKKKAYLVFQTENVQINSSWIINTWREELKGGSVLWRGKAGLAPISDYYTGSQARTWYYIVYRKLRYRSTEPHDIT